MVDHKLTEGQTFKLQSFNGDEILIQRLLDMGLYPGIEVQYIGRMPLRGPIIMRVESSFFALREEEFFCLKLVGK